MRTRISIPSAVQYVNPIIAVFLGWFFLGQPVSPRIFVAGAVIVLGVATITFSRNQKSKGQSTK